MKKIVFYFRFLVFIFSPDHQNHFDYQKFTPFLKQNKKYELLYCIYKLPIRLWTAELQIYKIMFQDFSFRAEDDI